MPTLYEIFTLRWGAAKDAEHVSAMEAKDMKIAQLKTDSREMLASHESTVENYLARISEMETAAREQAEAHVLTVEALEAMLAPFRKYVAATDPEAPETGNGDDGEGRAGEASGC